MEVGGWGLNIDIQLEAGYNYNFYYVSSKTLYIALLIEQVMSLAPMLSPRLNVTENSTVSSQNNQQSHLVKLRTCTCSVCVRSITHRVEVYPQEVYTLKVWYSHLVIVKKNRLDLGLVDQE